MKEKKEKEKTTEKTGPVQEEPKAEKLDRVITLNESQSNRILGIVFMVFGLILLFVIIPTQIKDVKKAYTGTRVFPQVYAIIILVLSGVLLVQSFCQKNRESSFVIRFSLRGLKKVGVTMLLLIVSTAVMNWIPYIPVTMVLLFLLMMLLGYRNWKAVIPVCVVLPILVYFFFRNGLRLYLP